MIDTLTVPRVIPQASVLPLRDVGFSFAEEEEQGFRELTKERMS